MKKIKAIIIVFSIFILNSNYSKAQSLFPDLSQLAIHHSKAASLVNDILTGDTTSIDKIQKQLTEVQNTLQSAQLGLTALSASTNPKLKKISTQIQQYQVSAVKTMNLAQTALSQEKPNIAKVKAYAQQAQALLQKVNALHQSFKSKI